MTTARYHRWLGAGIGALLGIAAPARAQLEVAPAGAVVTDNAVRARADALLARMTPEEKAAQLTQYFDFSGIAPPGTPENPEIAAGRAGSLLFVADPVNINRLQKIAVERTRLKIPFLFGFDVVHGFKTIFPVPIALAASWDPVLVQRVQDVAAGEARAVGIHWAFGPMVDISRDPRWGRMVEGAGEDPYLGSAMAAAQVRGFQGAFIGAPGHVLAAPKHFAGYGASLGGRDYDEVNLSDSELWNTYLPPFKAAVDAGAGTIMSAYMGLNGVPGAANKWLLSDVLRKEWGFKGFVVSDADAVVDLTTHGFARNPADAAARAIDAGVGMEMALNKAAMATLPASIAHGRVPSNRIDEAVRRVLETKIRMGLFEHPYVDEAQANAVLNDPAHRVLARVAAERSAVLLKNDGGLLPLDRHAIRSIAVIGPLADAPRDTLGPWVFKQDDAETVSILAGLRTKAGPTMRIDYSEGVRMPARLYPSLLDRLAPPPKPKTPIDDTAEIARSVALAKNADVAVVVVGEAWNMIGEESSRSSLTLPGRQRDLLDAVVATGKPVVILLMSARPLEISDTKARAILDIWYPGTQGGSAIANLLFGDAVPAGKLPFTWPRDVGQVPLIYSHLVSHKPEDASRRYWNAPNTPAYPFGFGLSYSTFRYSNVTVDHARVKPGASVVVSADLTNTGSRTADEVAQLYIHQRFGTAARPVRELKGFQRVKLDAGETRRVTFTLSAHELQYWNAARRDWVQDESQFDAWVGPDAAASLGTQFSVEQ